MTNLPSSTSLSLASAVRSVVHDDFGGRFVDGAHDVTWGAPTAATGVSCVHVSPVDTDMSSAATLSLAAALSSVVHDDIGGGVVGGACAVTACVATSVTGVTSIKKSLVHTNVPSADSVSLAAAMTSVFGDDIAGGVVVDAHVSPVATNTPSTASPSLAAAVWFVVENKVAIATSIACAVASYSFVVVRQVTHAIATVSDLVLRHVATVQ